MDMGGTPLYSVGRAWGATHHHLLPKQLESKHCRAVFTVQLASMPHSQSQARCRSCYHHLQHWQSSQAHSDSSSMPIAIPSLNSLTWATVPPSNTYDKGSHCINQRKAYHVQNKLHHWQCYIYTCKSSAIHSFPRFVVQKRLYFNTSMSWSTIRKTYIVIYGLWACTKPNTSTSLKTKGPWIYRD